MALKGEMDGSTILMIVVLMVVLLVIVALALYNVSEPTKDVIENTDTKNPPGMFDKYYVPDMHIIKMEAFLKENRIKILVNITSHSSRKEDVYLAISSYPESFIEKYEESRIFETGNESATFESILVNTRTYPSGPRIGEPEPFYVIVTMKTPPPYGNFIDKMGLYCDISYPDGDGGYICY